MTSEFTLASRSESCAPARMMSLVLVVSTLLFGGLLQAQSLNELNKSEISYFNDLKTSPESGSVYGLTIGNDILNANNFNYTDSIPKSLSTEESAPSSPSSYRTVVLIMGIFFVLVTFINALILLLKNANRTPISVAIAHEP